MSFLKTQRKKAIHVAEKCIECGRCFQYCPFDIFPKDHLKCYYLIRQANSAVMFGTPISNELKKMLYKCSVCDRCFDVCPEEIHRADANLYQKLKLPNPVKQSLNLPSIIPSIKIGISSVGLSAKTKEERNWIKSINTLEPARVMVYHGCYINFSKDTCMRLENILTLANESFSSVGGKNFCCGGIDGYRGQDNFKKSYSKLKKVIEKINPFEIITTCGHCFEVLDRIIYEMDVDIKVRHATGKILEYVEAKKIKLHKLETSVTIHDACLMPYLYEDDGPVRKLLKKIVTVNEMQNSKDQSNCCGNISLAYDSRLVDKQNEKIIKQFHDSKASHICTYCPRCTEIFDRYPKDTKALDIIDIIYDSIFRKQYPSKIEFVPKLEKKKNDDQLLSIDKDAKSREKSKKIPDYQNTSADNFVSISDKNIQGSTDGSISIDAPKRITRKNMLHGLKKKVKHLTGYENLADARKDNKNHNSNSKKKSHSKNKRSRIDVKKNSGKRSKTNNTSKVNKKTPKKSK
ncbi:MAG: (Fe-S)-binding protein [Candidatus Woesearchaeota archaeon]